MLIWRVRRKEGGGCILILKTLAPWWQLVVCLHPVIKRAEDHHSWMGSHFLAVGLLRKWMGGIDFGGQHHLFETFKIKKNMLFLVILGERLKRKIRKWPNGEEKALLTFGTIVLCCEGQLVHYRMFSSIPGLYPLDGDSAPQPPVTAIKYLQTWPQLPCGTWLPHWSTADRDYASQWLNR